MRVTPHGVAQLGVIVVAAGRGERLGADTPKAFTRLGDRTLIEHAIRTITRLPEPGQLVLVVPEQQAATALELVSAAAPADSVWQISIAHGGRERHESVRFGLDALHDSVTTVLVHDAARPLTPLEVFERVTAAVRQTGDTVIPVVAVADTLKRRGPRDTAEETVDRSALAAVQTPQGFQREILTAAHTALPDDRTAGAPTDDAELVQRAGGTVRFVDGSPYAHKLTVPADLFMLEGLLAASHRDSESAS